MHIADGGTDNDGVFTVAANFWLFDQVLMDATELSVFHGDGRSFFTEATSHYCEVEVRVPVEQAS